MQREEILAWLQEENPQRLEELWQLADETRKREVGDAVHLRGLV
jgi:predicted Zn-ribbon and HTH transcriptional regulator